MRSLSRFTIVVLCAVCALLGYLVLRQHAELASARSDSQAGITALKVELASAKADLAKVNKLLAAGQRTAPGTAATKAPARAANTPAQISDIIKAHPEFEKLYAKFTRSELPTIYGAGLNSLDLPPQQLNRLKELLTERQMSYVDAVQAAALAGMRPASAEWQQAVNEASLSGDQEIKGILGPDAEATLAELKSNVGRAQALPYMETEVTGMTSDFIDAGVPLTADQSAGLAKALLNAYYWQGRDLSDRPVEYNEADPTSGLSIHDNRNLANAAQVLTPDQLNVMRNYAAQMEQVYAIQRQYRLPLGP